MFKKMDTSLIIVDMQNDFVLPGAPACISGAMATIPNIQKLLERFRDNMLPVVFVVREYRADGSDIEITRMDSFLNGRTFCIPGTPGCEIVDGLKPAEGEYRVVKNRYSAFMNTELDYILRRLGIQNIIVCGTQYPVCIRTTVFDGVAHGYNVTVITDSTSAQTLEIAEANIHDIRNIGVECINTVTFLSRKPTP